MITVADIGKRIRERREQIGITQEELATKLGYKNKSTIAKIENGTNDIVQSKVTEFAKVLDTTPAYLMGWESEDELRMINDMLSDVKERVFDFMGNAFGDTEINHMRHFDALNRLNQQKVISYADNLLKVQQVEEEQSYLAPLAAHERTDIEITDEMRKHDDDIMNDDDFWNK